MTPAIVLSVDTQSAKIADCATIAKSTKTLISTPQIMKTITNTFTVSMTNGPVRRAKVSVRATSYAEASNKAKEVVAAWEAARPYDQLPQGVNWRWTVNSVEVALDPDWAIGSISES